MLPILIMPESGCSAIGLRGLNKEATTSRTSYLVSSAVVSSGERVSTRICDWWRWYCEFPQAETIAIGRCGDYLAHPSRNILATNLLADCERMLRTVARRWRKALDIRRTRSLANILGSPIISISPVLSVANISAEAIAWLLWSMSWWGMSDARSLFAKRLHPATGIVRWLSAVPLKLQEEHAEIALRLLAHTFDLTRTLWRQVADRMRRRNAYLLDPRIIDVQFVWENQKSIAT